MLEKSQKIAIPEDGGTYGLAHPPAHIYWPIGSAEGLGAPLQALEKALETQDVRRVLLDVEIDKLQQIVIIFSDLAINRARVRLVGIAATYPEAPALFDWLRDNHEKIKAKSKIFETIVASLLLSFDQIIYTDRMKDTKEEFKGTGAIISQPGKKPDSKSPPPSKRPGYVRDSRAGKVVLSVHVPADLRNSVHLAAARCGVTTQDYIAAVLGYASAHQAAGSSPIRVPVEAALEQHRDLERAETRAALLRAAASLG